MSNFLGGSLPSNVGSLGSSAFKGGIGDMGYGGFNYDTSYLGDNFFTNKGDTGSLISTKNAFRGRSNPFSGENALKGFKSLLDVSNAMGDRRQGSYKQTGFSGLGGLFGNSRGGVGGMQLSSGPFGTTTYFPDSPSQGYGGYGGEGQKGPTRFAKVAGGAASGALMGMKAGSVGGVPGMAAGAILGGLGGLFS